ncbi:MAG: alkylation response protein AidB-like acyl-CoA dehydrogenase, partial [Gammaproteobacteria bacterium]
PEEFGGQGFGPVELCMVAEEMGRALLCAPFFGSIVLGATAIMNAATQDQQRMHLPGIASGTDIATLAFTEENGSWDFEGCATTATESADGFALTGVKSFVLDGHRANKIVVLARASGTVGDDGLSLFLVDGDAAGLSRRALRSMDPTRKIARIEFNGVSATLLGEQGTAAGAMAKTLDLAVVALANEMVGGAERLREDALAYAQMRIQFGRSIASFQAIKHKCAEMLVDVNLAKAAAYYAAAAVAEGETDVPAMASMAKAAASDTYMHMAIEATQIHGGVGFTWENDTHLWFKRAKSSEVFLGTPAYHRERMLQHWDAIEGAGA